MTATDDVRAIPDRAHHDLSERQKVFTLLVTCAVIFLDSLDTSTVGVALPSIQHDLSMNASSLQWLVSGYTVAYGGFLLLGGRAADLLGRRRVFVAATVIFMVASVIGGAVSSPGLIIASRVAKGVAAAFTAPAAFSIITTTFREGPERTKALSVYGATAAVGYSIGLIASGLLTSISWRLVFFVPAVLALLVLVVTPMAVRPDDLTPVAQRRSYDPAGALVSTSAILLFVYALVQAPVIGWGTPATLGSLAMAAALLVAFLVIESRHSDPTLPLGIFRSRTRSSSYLIALTHGAAAIGWQFVVVLYLQRVLEYSAFKISMAVLPIGVTIYLVAQFVTSKLIGRFGIRAVCIAGMTLQTIGVGLFTLVGQRDNYFALILPGLVIHGIACGVVFASVNVGGVGGVEDSQQGVAAGMIVAAYAIGTGLGAAVLAAVITASGSGSAVVDLLHGYRNAFAAGALIAVAGLVFSVFGLPSQARDRQNA